MSVVIAVIVAAAILGGGYLGLREMARQEAAVAELGDDTWIFNPCGCCDGGLPQPYCTCQGDCGRRGCPWPLWARALNTPQWRREIAELTGEKR
jgi:hypothetical protein